MIGEMLSRPEAVDFREDMAKFNSDMVKILVRIWGGEYRE
jgi:hypothetical protein